MFIHETSEVSKDRNDDYNLHRVKENLFNCIFSCFVKRMFKLCLSVRPYDGALSEKSQSLFIKTN